MEKDYIMVVPVKDEETGEMFLAHAPAWRATIHKGDTLGVETETGERIMTCIENGLTVYVKLDEYMFFVNVFYKNKPIYKVKRIYTWKELDWE